MYQSDSQRAHKEIYGVADTGVFAEPSTIHENPNELVSGDAEEGGAFVVAEEETPDMQVATTAQLKTRIASSRTTSGTCGMALMHILG